MSRVLVLVPARGGSKGLPGKNLRTVGGVSLVGRAVLQGRRFVQEVGFEDDATVFVDTDSDDIASEGRRWGASVPFLRPPELALDTTPTIDNVLHAVRALGGGHDSVVLLQPTSPLRRVEDILRAWEVHRGSGSPSVATVSSSSKPLDIAMRMHADGRLEWAAGEAPRALRRQDLTPAVWPNGAVYVASRVALERDRAFLVGGSTHGVTMPSARSLDVDTLEDLMAARTLCGSGTPPGWPSGIAVGGDPVGVLGEEDPTAGWALLPAEADLAGTVERIFTAPVDARDRIAVRLDAATAPTEGLLAQIVPLRDLFDVPSVWTVPPAGEDAALRAAVLGVAALGGACPDDLLERCRSVRREAFPEV